VPGRRSSDVRPQQKVITWVLRRQQSDVGKTYITIAVPISQPYNNNFQNRLPGFPGLFSDTSELIRFYLLLFSFLLLFSCRFRAVD